MIRFLYKETTPEETAAIQFALDSDWALREKFQTLKSTVEGLNKVSYSPRESVVQSLLNYAGLGNEVEHH
ncbi:MAG: hypothetical protein KIT80_03405 [Chitinophagaceae bacterium]|nr:hypothetical protein [Chitinophagaceae bacterium]MCW5925933.1 hypothetical protein [Chitinophagaceae bacterium]